jgi:hypothetical protein
VSPASSADPLGGDLDQLDARCLFRELGDHARAASCSRSSVARCRRSPTASNWSGTSISSSPPSRIAGHSNLDSRHPQDRLSAAVWLWLDRRPELSGPRCDARASGQAPSVTPSLTDVLVAGGARRVTRAASPPSRIETLTWAEPRVRKAARADIETERTFAYRPPSRGSRRFVGGSRCVEPRSSRSIQR